MNNTTIESLVKLQETFFGVLKSCFPSVSQGELINNSLNSDKVISDKGNTSDHKAKRGSRGGRKKKFDSTVLLKSHLKHSISQSADHGIKERTSSNKSAVVQRSGEVLQRGNSDSWSNRSKPEYRNAESDHNTGSGRKIDGEYRGDSSNRWRGANLQRPTYSSRGRVERGRSNSLRDELERKRYEPDEPDDDDKECRNSRSSSKYFRSYSHNEDKRTKIGSQESRESQRKYSEKAPTNEEESNFSSSINQTKKARKSERREASRKEREVHKDSNAQTRSVQREKNETFETRLSTNVHGGFTSPHGPYQNSDSTTRNDKERTGSMVNNKRSRGDGNIHTSIRCTTEALSAATTLSEVYERGKTSSEQRDNEHDDSNSDYGTRREDMVSILHENVLTRKSYDGTPTSNPHGVAMDLLLREEGAQPSFPVGTQGMLSLDNKRNGDGQGMDGTSKGGEILSQRGTDGRSDLAEPTMINIETNGITSVEATPNEETMMIDFDPENDWADNVEVIIKDDSAPTNDTATDATESSTMATKDNGSNSREKESTGENKTINQPKETGHKAGRTSTVRKRREITRLSKLLK